MTMRIGFYSDTSSITFSTGPNGQPQSWVHALPGGIHQHPVYGELKFTDERIGGFAKSVTQKYRQIDPDVDYDHKQDPAMGNKAAGWITAAETRLNEKTGNQDLWVLVDWTPAGATAVKNKEFRYYSSEIADEWTDATGAKYQDVVMGGGITNRPYMKQLVPLNLSELQFSTEVKPTEGEQVDPKELRRKLGLSESATDTEVDARIATLSEAAKPKDPTTDVISQLAENNPAVKAFMDRMASMEQALKDSQAAATLAETTRKLGDLSRGKKFSFSAAVLNELRDILIGADAKFSDKVFSILNQIVDGGGLVQLGEGSTGGSVDKGSVSDGSDPEKAFNDAIAAVMEKDKLTYADAMERVAKLEPQKYNAYRAAMGGGSVNV